MLILVEASADNLIDSDTAALALTDSETLWLARADLLSELLMLMLSERLTLIE